MSYTHLTIEARIRIEVFISLGWSTRQIAKALNIHHATVAREIKRATVDGRYNSAKAHDSAVTRRLPSARKCIWDTGLNYFIAMRLVLTWSPEMIAGRAKRDKFQCVSAKTIYNWLGRGYMKFLNHGKETTLTVRILAQRGQRRGSNIPEVIKAVGVPIRLRPKEVNQRAVFGHWEADTVVSSRGKSTGCLATFCERTTRKLIAFQLPNRTAEAMNSAIEQLVAMLPRGAVKSLTVDRGKEFASYRSVATKCHIRLYFADPFSAWQRGTIENANGLLRRFYPKQTDLALIDPRDLDHSVDLINNRPRACLGVTKSDEAFKLKLSQLI